MLKLKNIAYLFFLVSLIFQSCQKDGLVDPVVPNPSIDYDVPVNMISASLSGIVTDEDGAPVNNATVRVDNRQVLTDENGVFLFRNVSMNEFGTLVKINKTGYFTASKMLNPRAGDRSNTRVMLLSKTIVGTVMADAGGSLTANGNSKITLPASGIIKGDGTPYSGEVSVAARWMDPTSDDLAAMTPGDLRAVNTSLEFVQLATYGMLAVELEGTSGEALNLAEGSSANLEFPVPQALRDGAPSVIPLWYFNENTGYWEEEGQATFDGEKYVGQVSHFSFWNCDVGFPLVDMEGTLVDPDGNPLPDLRVKLTINSSALTRYGYSDENGVFGGEIPRDEELTLSVEIDGSCSGVVYTATIGPFSSDVVLSPIVVDFSGVTFAQQVNLLGQMENCSSALVTNGYVKGTYGDNQTVFLFPDDNGLFSNFIIVCADVTSIDLQGFDIDEAKETEISSFPINPGVDVNFGTLTACEDLTESLSFSIDGIDFLIIDPYCSVDSNFVIIDGFGPDSTNVYLLFEANAPVIISPSSAYFGGQNGNNFPYANCSGATTNCANFEVNLTNFAEIGELMEGTFNGTLPGSHPSGTSTVIGTFRVFRE
ncbi:MAG: carboxypeptidase-like regulatory domain-containing protein [Bacteroidota bacterium]